jgi:hypothetical protein
LVSWHVVLRTRGVPAGTPLASPAQMLDLIAAAVAARADRNAPSPGFILSRTVAGPAEPAPEMERSVQLSAPEVVAMCREIVAHVGRTGRLPSSLRAEGVALSPAALLQMAAEQFMAGPQGQVAAPVDALPEGTEALVQQAIYERLPGWPPHRPDLRLDLLAQQTALQCWSLKPAVIR